VIEATLILADGKIKDVLPGRVEQPGIPFESFGDKVIMPGVIDAHVHINEPGRTEWEGFETATKAAAAGGITTLIEMPLNASPVTTTVEALKLKLEAAKGKLHVNVGFYGGVIPNNIDDLHGLLNAGVFGIKAFLTHSGIDEFPNVTEADLRRALPILKEHGAKLLVHCELEGANTQHVTRQPVTDPRSYPAYLASRPAKWETDAIALMIRLSEEYDVHVHIVHVSAAEALPLIFDAKRRGLRITAETCPHYLVFCAEEIPDGATEFKCAPPIRERANNELLWEALKDGTLDFVATDHSPAPPDIKEQQSGDFMKAWGGIAGLQFLLPVFWTGAKERGFSVKDVARLLCEHPADFLGLKQKGRIAAGCDADLVIWDPEASFVVKEKMIQHRHKLTPYVGCTLRGAVERTIVGGGGVFPEGHLGAMKGILITRAAR
jgi:allantoinase